MRTRLTAAVFAAALALAACGGDDTGGADREAGADVSPAELLSFEAQTVSGDTVDVGEYAGSDLVIWFWAPW